MRRGWTLHEMVISLSVGAGIVALAVHAALGELRFFRGAGEIAAVRGQLHHTTGITRALLWGVSRPGGDITAALDTALELRVSLGTAVVCESGAAWVIIPAAGGAAGNTLSAFVESPQPDDRVAAYFEDSAGGTWLTLRVAAAPVGGAGCPRFPSVTSAWTVALQEQLIVPAGAVLRFMRPIRVSLYRASDGRWYLGARDWNAESARFNTIQPVAGPLDPPSPEPARAGLRFEYLDGNGDALADPVDPSLVAAVRIVARGASPRPVRVAGMSTSMGERYVDSAAATFALRNAR